MSLLFCSQSIEVIHLASNRCHSVQVPVQLGSVLMISKDDWLITEAGNKRLVGWSGHWGVTIQVKGHPEN